MLHQYLCFELRFPEQVPYKFREIECSLFGPFSPSFDSDAFAVTLMMKVVSVGSEQCSIQLKPSQCMDSEPGSRGKR